MSELVEIELLVSASDRLTAGFVGWEVDLRDGRTVLRRRDATAVEVEDALTEVGALGLDLEELRRLETA